MCKAHTGASVVTHSQGALSITTTPEQGPAFLLLLLLCAQGTSEAVLVASPPSSLEYQVICTLQKRFTWAAQEERGFYIM
jgi:hypothetical protein